MHTAGADLHPPSEGVIFTHRVAAREAHDLEFLGLPASPGAAAVFDEQDRPCLLAATGDLRAWARRKLARTEAAHPAFAAVSAVQCGSMLEADLQYLSLARRFAPAAAALAAERARAWWACIDPDSEFPEWTKSNLLEGGSALRSASTARNAPNAEIVGPFADKDAAARFAELVTDVFDLCRERKLLVLAPHARACAYKEMGRCPAPCDGSESMESYRARVRAAIVAAVDPDARAGLISKEQSLMNAAVVQSEFEAAARHKAQADRLARLGAGAFARTRRLSQFRFAIVWRAPREGWVRLAACRAGQTVLLGDAACAPRRGRETDLSGLRQLAAQARDWALAAEVRRPNPAEVDELGFLTREYLASDSRRCAWFVPVNPDQPADVWINGVLGAARACVRPRRAGSPSASGSPRGAHEPDHELPLLNQ